MVCGLKPCGLDANQAVPPLPASGASTAIDSQPVDAYFVSGQGDNGNAPTDYQPKFQGGILLAQLTPPATEIIQPAGASKHILELISNGNLRQQAEAIFAKPKSNAAKVMRDIAGLFLNDDELVYFFSLVLPELVSHRLIKDLQTLDGDVGKRFFELAEKSKGGISDVFHFGIPQLVDRNVVTDADVVTVFNTRGSWIDSLAEAAGAMKSEVRWKVFHFGIDVLLQMKLLKKENLDEAFRYEDGSMLFEMAKASHVIDAGKDYFGYVFADWLDEVEADDLTPELIARFIRETAEPAGRFYKAGHAQREAKKISDQPPYWRTFVRNYVWLLPRNDMAKTLDLLARTLENPLDPSLPKYIEQQRKIHFFAPQTVEEVFRIKFYQDFLRVLTQDAEVPKLWLENTLNLGPLADHYRNEPPTVIYDVASILNEMAQGLGDKWIREGNFPLPKLGDQSQVAVNVSNVQDIFAKYQIIKIINPKGLDQYKFVWSGANIDRIPLANLGRIIVAQTWLKDIVGVEAATKAIGEIDPSKVIIDAKDFPREFMTMRSLNELRETMNARSAPNNTGDTLISALITLFGEVSVVNNNDLDAMQAGFMPISLMIQLLKGWSDLSAVPYGDIQEDCQQLARGIAGKVAQYFNNQEHRGEFGAAKDSAEIRKLLMDNDAPLWMDQKDTDVNKFRMMMQKRRQEREKL